MNEQKPYLTLRLHADRSYAYGSPGIGERELLKEREYNSNEFGGYTTSHTKIKEFAKTVTEPGRYFIAATFADGSGGLYSFTVVPSEPVVKFDA